MDFFNIETATDAGVIGAVAVVIAQGLALLIKFTANLVMKSIGRGVQARKANQIFMKALATELMAREKVPFKNEDAEEDNGEETPTATGYVSQRKASAKKREKRQ